MKRKSCTFFSSWLDASELMDGQDREAFIMAVLRYLLRGERPNLKDYSIIVQSNLINALPTIENSIKRAVTGSTGGSRGGAPKGNKNASKGNPLQAVPNTAATQQYRPRAGSFEERKHVSKPTNEETIFDFKTIK